MIDPKKFFSGEYALRLKNSDDESTFTGLAEIQVTKSTSEEDAADNDEIKYDPSIELISAFLESDEQYKSFDELLKEIWDKEALRQKLLGNIMANVPAETGSWQDFSSAVKREYASMIYEKNLYAPDLVGVVEDEEQVTIRKGTQLFVNKSTLVA